MVAVTQATLPERLGKDECGFYCEENPLLPGVYRVRPRIHGEMVPSHAGHPTLCAYYDGVDTWSSWQFTRHAALRASPAFVGVMNWKI